MSPPLRKFITTELGQEAQCAKCQEFWPVDPEFFFMHKGKPHSWCKACFKSDPKVRAKVSRAYEKTKIARANERIANQAQQEQHA